jgi:catechol 2,3-dioxygenase-like lactoylglutathione lyase family enzyme
MTTININGVAHVMLSVASFAAAREFYGRLLPAIGMTPVCDTDKLFYCVGGRTAIGIQPATESGRFEQGGVGLHHLCLRARSRDDIDRLHELLREMGATIVQAPQEGTWAPGYYSVLFEDPDGIRLEANFVPGAGVLAPGVSFDPSAGYQSQG